MKSLWIFISAMAIATAVSAQSSFSIVPTPPERILQNGYSLVPPNEKGWLIVERNAYQLALAKRGNNPDETIAIQALPFRLPRFKTEEEFIHFIQEGQAKDTGPQRFTILKHDVTPYPMQGTECAKSFMVTEDHAAVKRSSQPGNMLLEALILTCAHPSDQNVGISILFSHRHYPDQGDTAFVENAQLVLRSVEFSEPKPRYFFELQQSNAESPSERFSTLCSKVVEATSAISNHSIKNEGTGASLQMMDSLGISIGRNALGGGKGSYAIFEKNSNGRYSLVAVKPYSIYPTSNDQEILFISASLNYIAPAFTLYNYSNNREAFVCGTGDQRLTGINTSGRKSYNPCDSSLTSAVLGPSILANTLLTLATLGTNIVTGSTASFVDTNKGKVADLVNSSKLLQCLNEANLTDIKSQALFVTSVATDNKASSTVIENDDDASTVNCVANGERVWTKPSKCDP